MGRQAKAGRCLERLVKMAIPTLQAAERRCPRQGRGDKPKIPEWVMAALIMIAVLKKKKTKSAQFRFLCEQKAEIARWLGERRFPSRPTYFRRYRRAHRLLRKAIQLQGERAMAEEADVHPRLVEREAEELEPADDGLVHCQTLVLCAERKLGAEVEEVQAVGVHHRRDLVADPHRRAGVEAADEHGALPARLRAQVLAQRAVDVLGDLEHLLGHDRCDRDLEMSEQLRAEQLCRDDSAA